MAKKTARTVDYYRGLPYTRRVRLESDEAGEYFVAYVDELQGVEADGDTPTHALYNLQAAFDDYLEAMVEWGDEIPKPQAWPMVIGWSADEVNAERGSASMIEFLPKGRRDSPAPGIEPKLYDTRELVVAGR